LVNAAVAIGNPALCFALWQQATIEIMRRNLSYYCLLAPRTYFCSSRTSRSWWITHLTQHHRRGCNTAPFFSFLQKMSVLSEKQENQVGLWMYFVSLRDPCFVCNRCVSCTNPTSCFAWGDNCRGAFFQILISEEPEEGMENLLTCEIPEKHKKVLEEQG